MSAIRMKILHGQDLRISDLTMDLSDPFSMTAMSSNPTDIL